uniref:Uncharacterized protein n=1 Tax=Knipowitschia caucasica TaxID=637954 RepID=A0AAV2L1N6_KNICA
MTLYRQQERAVAERVGTGDISQPPTTLLLVVVIYPLHPTHPSPFCFPFVGDELGRGRAAGMRWLHGTLSETIRDASGPENG